jgi:hypothetical protein
MVCPRYPGSSGPDGGGSDTGTDLRSRSARRTICLPGQARRGRRCAEVHRWLNRGLREVVDADLSGYFDTIPHPQLLKSLARRISDGSLMRLLKQWLQMPVAESDGRGGKRRSNPARRHKRGTPQGAPGELLGATAPWQNRSRPKKTNRPKTQNFGYCFNFNMLLPITRGNALRGQSFENGLGVFAGCFVSTSGRARNAPRAG